MTVKDVHKAPPFELVGWFTLGSSSGPQPHILPIHNRISELYTESPILLLFHPSDAQSEATAAGKLPLTLYESVFENATGGPNDKAMDIDGATLAKTIKFKELAYSVETGEAEMIGVDFVARGGGNATAVNGAPAAAPKVEGSKAIDVKGKTRLGDKKEKQKEEAAIDETAVLTADDEESKFAYTKELSSS
jgi:COP9 signalosome complex subunit 6